MIHVYTLVYFDFNNFLSEIEAQDSDLRARIVSAKHANSKLTVYLNGDSTPEEQVTIQSVVDNHNPDPEPPYRITELVKYEFSDLPLGSVDFKRHIKDDVALDKQVSMLTNGRPEKAIYYIEEVTTPVAEIVFTILDNGSLMTSRQEHLYYYREDGVKSPSVLIKNRTYDHTNEVDLALVIEERVHARTQIVDSLKGLLVGIVIQALAQTMEEVIETIKPFWDDCELERKHYIEFGNQDWNNYLASVDLTATPYTYLAIDIGGGVTMRDFILSRINY